MRNFIPILCLSVVLSSMGHPASSSAEGTGFCLPVDAERLDRHLQRAAAKPALLNAGAPRTVRMIYFVSDPQAFRQEVVEQMKTTIREVQRIFIAECLGAGTAIHQNRWMGAVETIYRRQFRCPGGP